VPVSWNLVRCVCGHHFGVKEGNRISCSRCTKTGELTVITSFSSSKKLSDAVASSNAPKEINKIINSRIQKIESKKKKNFVEISNLSKLRFLMKNATTKSGVLTLDNLNKELSKNPVGNITAENIIQTSEFEGIIIRAGPKEWTWL
jgi:hypothetical protein